MFLIVTLALVLPTLFTNSKNLNGSFHTARYVDKAMGTLIEVTLWTQDEMQAAQSAKIVFDEFKRVDSLMTTWLPNNSVGQINLHSSTQPVTTDIETFRLIKSSLDWSKKTKGAFDITVGAFKGLWKFDHNHDGSIPSLAAIQRHTSLVDYKKIQMNSSNRSVKFKKEGMKITLGGIAKGYALDNAVKNLHKKHIKNFIIQAGGDMYVDGQRGSRLWNVGIRDPRGPKDAVFAYASIQNKTFSTSGDYERFLIIDNIRYHHILNPKTGHPAKECRSVTVMTRSALKADVLSTALFVLGPTKGMRFVEERTDVEAIFVDKNGTHHVSRGLKGKIKFL